MAKPGAGSTQIVRSDYADAAAHGCFANDGPNNFCSETAALNLSGLAYRTEKTSITYSCGVSPRIDG
jgi:hypothetical protein